MTLWSKRMARHPSDCICTDALCLIGYGCIILYQVCKDDFCREPLLKWINVKELYLCITLISRSIWIEINNSC